MVLDDVVAIALPLIERVRRHIGNVSARAGAGCSFLGVGNPHGPSLQLMFDLIVSGAGPVVVGVSPRVLLLLFPGDAPSPHVRPIHPIVGMGKEQAVVVVVALSSVCSASRRARDSRPASISPKRSSVRCLLAWTKVSHLSLIHI